MIAPGLLLSDDLIFTSRIAATARAHGLTVVAARSPAQLLERATASPPPGVILDIQLAGSELPALVAALKALPGGGPRIVAYGSHVDAEGLRAARRAGCDRVMPRSQFAAELETSIGEWLGEAGGAAGG